MINLGSTWPFLSGPVNKLTKLPTIKTTKTANDPYHVYEIEWKVSMPELNLKRNEVEIGTFEKILLLFN